MRSAFYFRELTSAEQLFDYFRLRHLVYCREGYLQPQPLAVDIDPFDANCRFVGAYLLDAEGREERLVAGARMILPDGHQPHEETMTAMREAGRLPEIAPRPRVYNFQDIFDLKSVLNYCQVGQRQLVEFGRTVVEPELRSTGLGLKLVHALHGLALEHGIELGFAAVPPKLRGFYEKSGGRILENKGTSRHSNVQSDAIALVIDLERLSGNLKVAYRAQKHLHRYGTWRVCSESNCLDEHRHVSPLEGGSVALQAASIPAVEVHGWEPAVTRLPLLRRDLQLHDETLRDGMQSPSVRNPGIEAKIRLLDWMVALGIATANLGLPGAGGKVYEHTESLVCEVARRRLPLAVTLAGRTLAQDVLAIAQVSQKAGLRLEAGLFLGCSPVRQLCENWDLKTLLELTERSVRLAIKEGLDVMFVTEDTTRTPPEILEPLYHAAIQAGASAICLTDTVGQANPAGTAQLVGFASRFMREHGYKVRLDWHGHNDRGLAVANCLAAIEVGADRVHATVLGAGERVGNASMERLLVQLHRLSGRPLQHSALRGYLNWAHQHFDLPVPVDLRGLVLEVSHESALA